MKGPVDHARGLLEKARHDLVAAEAILATGEAFDMACFHAQQAVEKALKALLALEDVEYPLRHDLGELVALTVLRWPQVGEVADAILALGPFAVAVRYDAAVSPSAGEAETALATARQVWEWAAAGLDAAEGVPRSEPD